MLPVFAHLDADRMAPVLTDATSARPTFHFRLPDCRIDEADWSLAQEWRRWLTVERVAEDDALLRRLGTAWKAAHPGLTLSRHDWANRCAAILAEAGLDDAGEARA
jgi:hypothetical protein